MKTTSYFEAICSCGAANTIDSPLVPFRCSRCGKASIIDYSHGYSVIQLLSILDTLDAQRDHVVKVIEDRRDSLHLIKRVA